MQAVILAAGASTRIYPLCEKHNKTMIPLLGKTLLERICENLKKLGIEEIIIIARENLGNLGNLSHLGHLKIVVQKEPLGMGDGLLKAKDLLKDDFLLVHGHHFDVSDFFAEMSALKKEADSVLLAKKREDIWKYGSLKLEGNRVLGIVEKPKKGEEPSNFADVGIYLLPKRFLEILSQEKKGHYNFETALDKLCQKQKVKVVFAKQKAVSFKYCWDLLNLKNNLLEKTQAFIGQKAQIAKNVILEGKVIIEDGAVIMENAVIKGPAYIGRKVMIGNSVLIRAGTVVEENCEIGAFSEIKNSVFLAGTHFGGGGFIGSSIIGEDCRLGHGFIAANKRFDRKQIKVVIKGEAVETGLDDLGVMMGEGVSCGIGVRVMPGTTIGSRSTIGPGTVVFEDVPVDTDYKTEFKNITKKKI